MKKDKHLLKIIRKLVEASFADGRIIEKEVIKSIKILKALPTSQAIFALSEFLSELKRRERAHTMYIETAIPLSPIQVQKAKKIVEKKKKITKVVAKVNPEILGGFKLQVGDEIWDQSFLGKINQVKEAILSGRSNSSN